MPCMTLPSSPVISICIRRYPKRKDESIPWTTVESVERNRMWDGMTYYRPFPMLKNRDRFFLILYGIVNNEFLAPE